MTLKEKMLYYLHKEIEETYTGDIQRNLSYLLSLRKDDLPIGVVRSPDKYIIAEEGNEEAKKIKMYQLYFNGTLYIARIYPELLRIELIKTTTKVNKKDRIILSFSLQQELFGNYTRIIKADIEDMDKIQEVYETLERYYKGRSLEV